MYGSRVCSAKDLLYMATMADKYEFNRRVETERLVEDIDPDGFNILECMMPFHRASMGPTPKDAPLWPDHHRCYVYAKVKDQADPVNFWLDVEVSVWERLKTIEEFMSKAADPVEMGIARARALSEEDVDA
jgi:hypothetical protein